MRRTTARASRRMGLVLCAAAVPAIDSSAGAAVRDWQAPAGGAFSTAANWLPSSVPGANDTARFDLGGDYVVTFSQDVDNQQLLVDDDDVTLELGGRQYSADSVVVGDGGGHQGRLTLLDGTLVVQGGPSNFMCLGNAAGSDGRLIVSTGAALVCLTNANIGDDGGGTLTVKNGGTASTPLTFVGDHPGAEGAVVVDGAGSTWTVSAELFVGNDGAGAITVREGGTALTSRVKVGDETGSDGVALVDGVGSLWDDAVELIIANRGNGTLTISNGGEVTGVKGIIGDDPGSDGLIRVEGAGSRLEIEETLRVGRSGEGRLTVADGGEAVAATLRVGIQSGGAGTLRVTGDGSAVTATSAIRIGSTTEGTLDVIDGGTVTSLGDYEQTGAGHLEIVLGPETDGVVVAVTGAAELAGSLTVTLADGFVPDPGASFDIVGAAAVTGTFDSVSMPQGFDVIYEADGVTVDVGAAHLLGESAGDEFGRAVANAGDVDGDGVADLLVGAPFNDDAGADAGKVYVFSGSDQSLIRALVGAAAGDRFGWSVAGAGDVDGDTYDDILVGAPRNDDEGADAGRAYVYSGLDGSLLDTWAGEAAGDNFGWSVAGAGDVERDADLDFLIGAPKNDEQAKNAGKVYLHSTGTTAPVQTFLGEKKSDRFGWSVALLTRADGDVPGDLVVGAPLNDDEGNKAGKVYVFSGSGYPLLYSLTGKRAGDRFGQAVAAAGRLDLDDLDDLVVGSPYYDKGSAGDAGRIDVYAGLTGVRLWKVNGGSGGARLGWSANGAGDVDGDGVPDVVTGEPWRQNQKGRAYVWSGVDGSEVTRLKGVAAGSRLGYAVAGAGDLDGDGRAEVVIGAPRDDSTAADAGDVITLFSP